MTVPSHRAERFRDQIREKVAVLIAEELRDPRIGFTTVTRVEISADLQHARIWVSVLGDAPAQQRTLEGLGSARAYIRRELGMRLHLRRVPELSFVLDHGAEEAMHLEELLHNLREPQGGH
jgi:ribosome-binding factor A